MNYNLLLLQTKIPSATLLHTFPRFHRQHSSTQFYSVGTSVSWLNFLLKREKGEIFLSLNLKA